MSNPPETEFDLDQLFLPAWAQQPANKNLYAAFEGEREREPRRDRRGGDRGGERPRGRGDRPREGGARGPRGPGGPERGPGGRGPRREGPGRGPGPQRGGGRHPEVVERAPEPLPEVELQFRPDELGVDSLTRQIKMTGRAYPLFDIARLILDKPERHTVVFSAKKNAEGAVAQPLFACALDDTLWLSEDEAVGYVLEKHFTTFYQPERTQTEPPKGTYTFVAQCGMTGAILGPPNYHDYQNQLRRLHAERFARMPFDMFKSRVKIVRDEAVVKKWIEDQSWKTEYVCLNVPEPLKLPNREEVEKHFRQTHLASIIKPTESHEITGTASRSMPCRALQRLVRVKWEEQKRFPLQIATVLSQQFASRGLQFFKKDKTVTHVAVARPHYLDIESTPVSDNVKRLLDFINAHPKCSRRQLFEAIAPSALATMRQPAEGAAAAELTPEASALIADLHWLVHQGHVVEFANGLMETAKKPAPRPPKPEPAKKAEKAAVVGPASQTSMPATEAAPGSVEFVQPPNAVPGNDPAPVETAEQIQVATGAAERGETLPPNPGVSEAAPTDDKQA